MAIDINILRDLCHNRAVKYTAHIMARLEERGIYPSDIRQCIQTGRIIEQYPDDYPFPSCLVLGATEENKALHVVVGIGEGRLWLITAYYPDPAKWENDFSIRKEQQT